MDVTVLYMTYYILYYSGMGANDVRESPWEKYFGVLPNFEIVGTLWNYFNNLLLHGDFIKLFQ